MTPAGKIWNGLDADERMVLLRHCNTITHESIKRHEAALSWDELMPVTQRDLMSVGFSAVLGRDVAP